MWKPVFFLPGRGAHSRPGELNAGGHVGHNSLHRPAAFQHHEPDGRATSILSTHRPDGFAGQGASSRCWRLYDFTWSEELHAGQDSGHLGKHPTRPFLQSKKASDLDDSRRKLSSLDDDLPACLSVTHHHHLYMTMTMTITTTYSIFLSVIMTSCVTAC